MSNIATALENIEQVIRRGPYEATWESILARWRTPRWYEDAKFGIFIHWGVYCVPAFGDEWYPRNMYKQGSKEFEHHIKTWGPHNKFGYKDFIPRFNAERFDANQWAELFERSGAKFIVPVAEHHDGFPMYDCSFTDWCAAKMGPRRDIIGELSNAVRDRGMVFGASSHRAENYWFFDEGMKFESDVKDDRNAGLYGLRLPKPVDQFNPLSPEAPPKAHLDNWLARTCELVDKYQPQIVWFDWWIMHRSFVPVLQKFAAYYYNRGEQWDKGVAINYKYDAFPAGSAVFDVERGQLKDIRPQFWQTDTSVSTNSWGYIEGHKYKTVTAIIHDIIDIVSKNGAVLLNIGPKADGTIPESEQQMLLEIGKWFSVNGESIYSTRPWRTFGEGPTVVGEGSFTDTKRQPFTPQDVRFTTNVDTIYATFLGWPEHGQALVRSLGTNLRLSMSEIKRVSLLGHAGELKWSVEPEGLRVALPANKPCDHAYVLKIERAAPVPPPMH
jgi:alpha-L-fucosidase